MTIRLPNITAKTEAGQLLQIKSFMHQLVQDLNYAMSSMPTDAVQSSIAAGHQAAQPTKETTPVSTFNSIKALIIKSADIVNAYYDEITKLIDQNGLYVAESDFGTFKEETENTLYADNTGLTQQVRSIQTLFDANSNILDARICDGHINAGILYYDENANAVVGLEIGQRNTDASGNTTFHQFARFTAQKLSFFDTNGNEVAYISDRRLYVPEAIIENQLTMGHFVDIVQPNGSIITKYVKRGS